MVDVLVIVKYGLKKLFDEKNRNLAWWGVRVNIVARCLVVVPYTKLTIIHGSLSNL